MTIIFTIPGFPPENDFIFGKNKIWFLNDGNKVKKKLFTAQMLKQRSQCN